MSIETKRLILRRFEENDMKAIFLLFSDKEVNTFLPMYPLKDMEETKAFFDQKLKNKKYCFAICLKDDNFPIGYVQAEEDDSHDFGYALRKEYWHQGIVSEACKAVIEFLKDQGLPYITAMYDRNNPRSGAVMQKNGHEILLFLSGTVATQKLFSDIPNVSVEL